MAELIARFHAWRERRQAVRCARGRHHYKDIGHQLRCLEPGCGKRYGT